MALELSTEQIKVLIYGLNALEDRLSPTEISKDAVLQRQVDDLLALLEPLVRVEE